jgi:hypothetical protein
MATSNGEAFVKGGCGCIAAFLAIGFMFVIFGGSVHIDAGGAVMLFVMGGVIGLICIFIHRKGEQAGQSSRRLNPPRNHDHSPFDDPSDRFDDGPFDPQGGEEFRSNGPFDDWGGDDK